MKKLFIKRLIKEVYVFRKNILLDEKRNILEKAYKIDVVFRLYDILRTQAEILPPETLMWLLVDDMEILESMYQSWLKKEDNLQEELKEHVLQEIEKEVLKQREIVYGERYNTSA